MENEPTDYFRHETNLFRAFKEAGFAPRVFFEIGSSNSGWSYEMAALFPAGRFRLFEPLIDYRDAYRENTAAILRARPNFRVHKVAVGDSDGTIKMGVDDSGYRSSTLVAELNETFTEMIEVPVRRLDTLAFEQDLPRPDVLKMDVQGAELNVLTVAGSLLATVQLIQAEVWLTRGYWKQTPLLFEISEYLNARGFLLVAFGGSYYGDLHDLYAIDAFFARKELLEQYADKLPKGSLTGEG